MINILNEKDCCGCRACEDVCPKHCITMKEGTLGHLFPNVNIELCVKCNLCNSVCPEINVLPNANNLKKAFAALSLNQEIRNISSSGGIFYTLASYLIDNDYLIFGACFDDKLKLVETCVDNKNSLVSLCKSKYIQSSMVGVYKQIITLLEAGKKVMFCGTPCQNAAIKLYLKRNFENLFLIDFFCHGVPSQKYFDQCVELIEKRKKIKVINYSFRTKIKNGCTPHYYTLTYKKKDKTFKKIDFYHKSKYYAAFQRYINLRESCYNCKFSCDKRVGDITIGDFHNIEKYISGINRFDGVSTIIVNSNKGTQMLKKVSHNLDLYELNYDTLIKNNEIYPAGGTKRPDSRDSFIKDYNELSFETLNNKWFSKQKYVKQRIYYHMPKTIRKLLKKIGD